MCRPSCCGRHAQPAPWRMPSDVLNHACALNPPSPPNARRSVRYVPQEQIQEPTQTPVPVIFRATIYILPCINDHLLQNAHPAHPCLKPERPGIKSFKLGLFACFHGVFTTHLFSFVGVPRFTTSRRLGAKKLIHPAQRLPETSSAIFELPALKHLVTLSSVLCHEGNEP